MTVYNERSGESRKSEDPPRLSQHVYSMFLWPLQIRSKILYFQNFLKEFLQTFPKSGQPWEVQVPLCSLVKKNPPGTENKGT